jgi:hypothetical protein
LTTPGTAFNAYGNWRIENCTVVNYPTAYRKGTGSPVAYNCLAQGCGTSFTGVGGDYNCSDAGTPPGAHSVVGTVQFVDPANGDYHLAAGDAMARSAGTDLSADPALAFDTDIDGQLRPTGAAWDIGVDQTVSSRTALAATFDGSSYLSLASSSPVGLANGRHFTCSFWVQLSPQAQQTGEILSLASASNYHPFAITIDPSGLLGVYSKTTSGATALSLSGSIAMPPGSGWHHVLIAVNANQAAAMDGVHLYVDGVIDPSPTITTYVPNDLMLVRSGGVYAVGSDTFQSSVNFVRTARKGQTMCCGVDGKQGEA